MAKYIDKDKAYQIVLHYGSYVASAKISDMDSIELVRCQECVNWMSDAGGWCDRLESHMDPEYFCAYGEKE